jgi:hypothetical protein
MTSRLQNMNGINGIKFLLHAKNNRVRKSIGLTHTDHVEKDALVEHVRTVGDNRTVIDNFKRKFEGPGDTDKTQADNISRFVKRLRTEVNKPSDIPDFEIEQSDDGSVTFSLKKEKNILKHDDSEEGVSDEDVSVTITKEEVSSIIPEPDDSGSVFSFGNKSSHSTDSSISISIIRLGENKEEINKLFDEVPVEVPVPITSDDSTAYTSSTISSKSMFTEKDTSYREINIDQSVFDIYIKGKKDGIKKLKDEITRIKGEIGNLKSCIDDGEVSLSSKESKSGRSIIKPSRFKGCINPETGISLTEKIQQKREDLQDKEEQLDKKYKLIDGAVSVPTVDNTIKPLIVSDIEGFLMRNYGTTFPRHHATTMENVKLIDKAIMISNLFKDLSSYEDQLTLYTELSGEDRNYFTISDEEMDNFFGTIKNNLPEGQGKIDNWRKYMQLFPRAISKIPKIQGQDETNVRAFLHYALNSKQVKSQIGLVNLVNRLKTLAYLQMFPSELLSIDSSDSGPSAPKENIHDDGYGVSYAPFGEGTIIDISDDDWQYMMAVSPLPDGGGKKGGSKKKSKNTSQKKGGFLKGILKKITTCDCDKKGKRKDNKTRRRGGKKFTIRKNKKSGGKHTYRKKKGGKKQKRVRFTIKN